MILKSGALLTMQWGEFFGSPKCSPRAKVAHAWDRSLLTTGWDNFFRALQARRQIGGSIVKRKLTGNARGCSASIRRYRVKIPPVWVEGYPTNHIGAN